MVPYIHTITYTVKKFENPWNARAWTLIFLNNCIFPYYGKCLTTSYILAKSIVPYTIEFERQIHIWKTFPYGLQSSKDTLQYKEIYSSRRIFCDIASVYCLRSGISLINERNKRMSNSQPIPNFVYRKW